MNSLEIYAEERRRALSSQTTRRRRTPIGEPRRPTRPTAHDRRIATVGNLRTRIGGALVVAGRLVAGVPRADEPCGDAVRRPA
jgi:hypothetical protein